MTAQDPWALAVAEQMARENEVHRLDSAAASMELPAMTSRGFVHTNSPNISTQATTFGRIDLTKSPIRAANESHDFSTTRSFNQSPLNDTIAVRSSTTSSTNPSRRESGDISALKKIAQVMLEDINKENQKDMASIQDDESKPYHSKTNWNRLRIDDRIYKALISIGFRRPSRIQERAIPISLCEPPHNLIAQSQSGTGKTAAFVIAILSRINDKAEYPQALVLAPTYELAKQIGQVTEQLAINMEAKVYYAIKDGTQMRSVASICKQIIIGTPGTVRDLIHRHRAFDAKKIIVFVLDEADVMIGQQGHQDMSVRILKACVDDRDDALQCLFFSATYTDEVRQFAERITKFNKNTRMISIPQQEVILDSIQQYNVYCYGREEKFKAICNLYDGISIGQAIIFTHTRQSSKYLFEKMSEIGHKILMLTGEMTTEDRSEAIELFKTAQYRLLISTNVTARGIDIDGISMVVNYDLPYIVDTNNKNAIIALDEETYIHRIGRTGRFGKRGIAINLIEGEKDREFIQCLQRKFSIVIEELDTSDFNKLETIDQGNDGN